MQNLHKTRRKPPNCHQLNQPPPPPSSHFHCHKSLPPLKLNQLAPRKHLKLCQKSIIYLAFLLLPLLHHILLLLTATIQHIAHKYDDYEGTTRNSNTDNQYHQAAGQFVSDNYDRRKFSSSSWSLVKLASAAETAYILRDQKLMFSKNSNISINLTGSAPIKHQLETNHQRLIKVSGNPKQQPVARVVAGPLAGSKLLAPGGSKVGLAQQQHQQQQQQQQQDNDPYDQQQQLKAKQKFADDEQPDAEFNGIVGGSGLQISITPRNGQIRVPVGENTILKCLISSQVNKFTRKFDVHWSRYMYDENVYEQLESFTSGFGNNDENNSDETTTTTNANAANNLSSSSSIQDSIPTDPASVNNNNNDPDNSHQQPELSQPINRQQQLRNFLSRSRQETNPISDLLIEATLSISPVKASDNATYYCKATDGTNNQQMPSSNNWQSISDQHQDRARIDLVALSKPVVRLDRIQAARDSKSAQINWLILSDGNTPIKRTILMVRNESLHHSQLPSSSSSLSHHSTTTMQQQETDDPSGSLIHPSVVVDSDKNQWQRIDISGDGELPVDNYLDENYNQQPSSRVGSSLLPSEDSSIVRADVDITSLGGSGSGSGFPSDSSDHQLGTMGTRGRPPNWSLHNGRPIGTNRRRSFNLTSLLPGVTYHLKLAAINDMGQSNWTHLSKTMPNEIPAQIGEMFLLSRSTDFLAIGWKRPAYDGAKTIRYEMQLFDLNRTLTLDANTNTTSPGGQPPSRTNFMYYFVNLNPGTDYHFHVRACSRAGCSAFSQPKLLASTLDGESDEPVDVELNCQMMDHQQQQQQQSATGGGTGNASISWLPPVNVRGQLTNYSVHLESHSRYLNQSGQWQTDEWRSTMETPNNHTLSLDMGGLLVPNTNYTVRVCANNRSKHCGRLSSVSARTQCSTPPELPQQLPAGLKLSLAPLSSIANYTIKQQLDGANNNPDNLETIVLDLPTISRRNGSIDCIQVVLIRLPDSYSHHQHQDRQAKVANSTGGGYKFLDQFLPREPSDIRLVPYANLQQQQPANTVAGDNENGNVNGGDLKKKQETSDSNERALAYLADEISGNDYDNGHQQQQQQQETEAMLASGVPRKIVLGDGGQTKVCRELLHTASEELRPFDGGLRPSTYYTGFIRLLMIRHNRLDKKTELVAKYSGYFEPIKSGKLVIDLPPMQSGDGDEDLMQASGNVGENSLMATFNFSQVTSSMSNFQEFASRLGASLRSSAIKLYHNGSSFLSTNFKLETVSNYIMSSSPMMQLLQVGSIVLGLSLFLLLVIYLISLPNSMLRKRKRKLKRQLQKHQEAANQANNNNNQLQVASADFDHDSQQHPLAPPCQSPQLQQLQQVQSNYNETQQQNNGYTSSRHGSVALNEGAVENGLLAPQGLSSYHIVDNGLQLEQQQPNLHHSQQVAAGGAAAVGYGTATRNPQECPIHSSPMNRGQQHRDNPDNNQATVNRRPSVHVCHPIGGDGSYVTSQQQPQSTFGNTNNPISHRHHHHHHHEQPITMNSSSHQINYANQDYFARLPAATATDQYERNCRTTSRRLHTTNGLGGGNGVGGGNDYGNMYDGTHTNGNGVTVTPGNNGSRNHQHQNYTLNHQHNSALALAKKINKSIPLSLFGQVLDYRLRNNWLREEYEQLPRQQFILMTGGNTNDGSNGGGAKNLLLLKLRPQLIVSRNDTVSALISGNDLFDASLIRGGFQPTASNGAGGPLPQPPAAGISGEKRIICAKSPLDADSVWDFWRLVYEQEVSTMVMLTQTEDQQTGEIRCAQYWPTCDNEETTILSPCNEYVQKSTILPAKFKIRQETLEEESSVNDFKVRKLTFMVMATKPGENEQSNDETGPATGQKQREEAATSASAEGVDEAAEVAGGSKVVKASGDGEGEKTAMENGNGNKNAEDKGEDDHEEEENEEDEEEELVIVERTILHLQYFYWNTSSLANQMRLIKFIEMANERHSKSHEMEQQQNSPNSINLTPGTMLVHCSNGLGRSGLFTAMSFIVDELTFKLTQYHQQQQQQIANEQQQVIQTPKLNLFQLVTWLRMQREMLLSPYRLYELLYQLTLNCIPPSQDYTTTSGTSSYHHHHHHHQQRQQPFLQSQQQHGHHKHYHHHQQPQQYQMLSNQQQQQQANDGH